LEFDHAISYVTTIKKRFANEPYTYKKFLEILHTYQKEQRGIKEVLDEVSALFADHPDLLKEFTYFLPDTVQAQAKVQLDAAAKEAEERKRKQSKNASTSASSQAFHRRDDSLVRPSASARPSALDYDRSAPAPQPFAPQGRTPEQENQIIRSAHYGVVSFAPVKPPRKSDVTPAQAALKKGRPTAIPELPLVPNAAETAFFQRAKKHFSRKELQAEKPPTNKRHTPYAEFLKCLHLFGAGVLNKEEMFQLLKGLVLHGHAPKMATSHVPTVIAQQGNELLRDFEELFLGRGPFAAQEESTKDKSKYGATRTRDFDLEGCEHPTPSYWSYPSDYPASLYISHTGQSEADRSVLNNSVICVTVNRNEAKPTHESLEAYDAVRARRNAYEEAMFRLEDERYEVDMAIERNAQAMRQIEPFAEEVRALREQEEKDRQPIGRLQYQLNRYAINSIHINAIGRLYGEKGDAVLHHLVENPFIVLPIIYQRLKQKDTEWRNAKTDLQDKWNALQTANYEGTLDVRCFFNRRELERRFSAAMLDDECKRARTYCKYPERIKHSSIIDPFCPSFFMSCSDPGAVLYQPYSCVPCHDDVSHKDAVQLIMQYIKSDPNVTSFDRERIGRIWAEFMLPWFGFPVEWIAAEARESFRGKMNPGIVKCKCD
jgi:paired amphipathic helix protein Sin3a